MNLVVFAILVFCGLMAFKFIASGIEKKQIKKEVFDTIGSTRSGDTDNSQVIAIIESILEKNKVEILDVSVNVDKPKAMIYFSFKYKIDTNYVLFRHSEIIEVTDEIATYGI